MFSIPDFMDRQQRFSELCFVRAPGSTTVCVFLLHSLTKALHCGTSQHLFSVGTKGIAAAAATAAFPTSPNWPQHNQIRLAVFSYLSEGGHQVQTL